MAKKKIIGKKMVNSVINERLLLSSFKHPFLVNMHYAFQDRENLYLILDYLSGGDLRFHLAKARTFTEDETKFIICNILVGLEYLHSNKIMHRDIKPENIIFDKRGYARITDLGIAKIWSSENFNNTSGTPGYMAPEVMCKQEHGIAIDYYALGIIAFECIFGRRPYSGKTRKEIREQILQKQVQIKRNDIPEGISLEMADFINRLIQRKPINRLGLNGPQEVKQHPWLKDYPWDKLLAKEIEPPYRPDVREENFDLKSINEIPENNEKTDPSCQEAMHSCNIQELFKNYDFDTTNANNSNSNNSTVSLFSNSVHIN